MTSIDEMSILNLFKMAIDNICNYFLSCTSIGVMEGIDKRIKLIEHQAYGFVNFVNFRSGFLACFPR